MPCLTFRCGRLFVEKIGTNCLHLPETHQVIKLIRNFLEIIAPEVLILTETNVPHEENVSYFGKGDEAHAVYQFSLPPLASSRLASGTAQHLSEWAQNLAPAQRLSLFEFHRQS